MRELAGVLRWAIDSGCDFVGVVVSSTLMTQVSEGVISVNLLNTTSGLNVTIPQVKDTDLVFSGV